MMAHADRKTERWRRILFICYDIYCRVASVEGMLVPPELFMRRRLGRWENNDWQKKTLLRRSSVLGTRTERKNVGGSNYY